MERVDLQVEAMAQVHLISRYACYVQKATMTQTLEKWQYVLYVLGMSLMNSKIGVHRF